MKKLCILAAALALGTLCFTGCDMGGPDSSDTVKNETQNIVLQGEGEGEEPSTPCPDGDCNHDRMPFKKPEFRFKVPQGKHEGKGREKFRRRPHKRPTPAPEPENPETPAENNNN